MFGIILVSNALIGIVQEVRAKRTLDQLAVLSEPRVRGSCATARCDEVAVDDVVLDDLIELRSGDQIAADGIVRATTALQVDESLLTGESDPVDKETGDQVLSGSFVVAGSGRFQATAVGDDAYARKLATEARRFALARSELMDGINRILRYVTWAIFPVAVLLLVSQFNAQDDWREAVSGTVAGIVGMVPQGLVLLTSVAFGVAAVTLARRKVLVQELPAVEGLARVDVVCFDKTGTLTDGNIVFDRVERLDDQAPVEAALGGARVRRGPQRDAGRDRGRVPRRRTAGDAPGSCRSRRHASGARRRSVTTARGCSARPRWCWAGRRRRSRAEGRRAFASTGQRVLLLAPDRRATRRRKSSAGAACRPRSCCSRSRCVPTPPRPSRTSSEQGVALKVISGDNPHTVGAVAARVGHAARRSAARRPRAARGSRRARRDARGSTPCSVA